MKYIKPYQCADIGPIEKIIGLNFGENIYIYYKVSFNGKLLF